MAIPVLWIPGCLITQSEAFMHLVLPKKKTETNEHLL